MGPFEDIFVLSIWFFVRKRIDSFCSCLRCCNAWNLPVITAVGESKALEKIERVNLSLGGIYVLSSPDDST